MVRARLELPDDYFKDQKREKEQGSVDLSVAYAASETSGRFEIATPGRTWVFKAEDKDAGKLDGGALPVLNDLREEEEGAAGEDGDEHAQGEVRRVPRRC